MQHAQQSHAPRVSLRDAHRAATRAIIIAHDFVASLRSHGLSHSSFKRCSLVASKQRFTCLFFEYSPWPLSYSEPEAIRACAETSREVLTMARLAGVSSRIFGSAQHDEVLERNMGEWNHANDAAANPRAFQDDDDGPEAAALASPAPPLARSPVASRSSLPPSSASPYLSDVPVGIKANDVTRFAPSFSRDNTRLQFMRIADHGLKM